MPRGYYRVRQGDTLSEIAQRRHVSVARLIRWNGLKPPYRIRVGQALRIAPRATASRAARTVQVSGGARSGTRVRASSRVSPGPADTTPVVPGGRAQASGLSWAWPLPGPVIQTYRATDPARQGLRIACRPGEAVSATGPGVVVYSGSGLKGYGNLVIVKHNQTYLSAYGFNRRVLVAEGARVSGGQPVAECGEGPGGVNLLHFEVRRDGGAVNPLAYLPPRA